MDYKKHFVTQIKRFDYKYDRYKVWADMLTLISCTFSNAVDKANFNSREQLYMDTIKVYKKDEAKIFPEMLATIVEALEANPNQDFLGDVFNELELFNRNKGQFFTPYPICRMMAKMLMPSFDEIKRRGYSTISDCCCGSGAMLIAYANEAMESKINYQQNIFFVAQDIDIKAVMMCYIQLSLLGCAGSVICGDSLTQPSTGHPLLSVGDNVWQTPFSQVRIWNDRKNITRLDLLINNLDVIATPPATIEVKNVFQLMDEYQ